MDEYRKVLGLTDTGEVPGEPVQTEIPETGTLIMMPPAELAAVVHGEKALHLNGVETGLYEITKVTDYMDEIENLHPCQFCVVDMDQDGAVYDLRRRRAALGDLGECGML